MNKIVTIIRESRVARFLIPVGIILMVFGIIFFSFSNQNKDYVKAESTVTKVEVYEEAYTDDKGNRVDETYKAMVKFTANGKEYESELLGVSKYDVGDKVTIYYNPADPSQITMSKSLILPIAMIAAGIAALAGGIVSAVNAFKRIKKMNDQEKEWSNGK
ncbi:MAG: DUF3592 domain-containing protein [Clostridia bacterium]|nr:DUF3592 domain-containing protein [Clostridia bacterium]MBR3563326.1 DUF3592 domain-containing protein [Clostridia bacterium]MBR6135085.1 DUF3592 domain-containing protein [Clostridia bacterium]